MVVLRSLEWHLWLNGNYFYNCAYLDERQLTSSCLEHVLFHDLRGRHHAMEYWQMLLLISFKQAASSRLFSELLKIKGIILIWLETKIKLLEFRIDVLPKMQGYLLFIPLKNFLFSHECSVSWKRCSLTEVSR